MEDRQSSPGPRQHTRFQPRRSTPRHSPPHHSSPGPASVQRPTPARHPAPAQRPLSTVNQRLLSTATQRPTPAKRFASAQRHANAPSAASSNVAASRILRNNTSAGNIQQQASTSKAGRQLAARQNQELVRSWPCFSSLCSTSLSVCLSSCCCCVLGLFP